MIEKLIEYILCYAVAFGLGFLTCALCVMTLVYAQIQNAKTKAVISVRAKHAKRDKR